MTTKFKEKIRWFFDPLALVIATMFFLIYLLAVAREVSDYYLGVGATIGDLGLPFGVLGITIAFVVIYIFSRFLVIPKFIRDLLGPTWSISLAKMAITAVLFFLIDGMSYTEYDSGAGGWRQGFPFTHTDYDGFDNKGFKDFGTMGINFLCTYLAASLFLLVLIKLKYWNKKTKKIEKELKKLKEEK